jgi:hypothetical protein
MCACYIWTFYIEILVVSENMEHFLLKCTILQAVRYSVLDDIDTEFNIITGKTFYYLESYLKIHILLDCSVLLNYDRDTLLLFTLISILYLDVCMLYMNLLHWDSSCVSCFNNNLSLHTGLHPLIYIKTVSTRDANRIPIKLKVVSGQYILQANRARFNQNQVDTMI